MTQIDPVEALREIAYLMERAGGQTRKATAFRKAADVLTALTPADRAVVDAARSWTCLLYTSRCV